MSVLVFICFWNLTGCQPLISPGVICASAAAAAVAVLQVMQKHGLFCLKQIPHLLEMCH